MGTNKRKVSAAFILLVFSLCILSCSKSGGGDDGNPPVPTPKPDTLSAGWSKEVAGSSSEIFTDVVFADALNGYACSQFGVYRSGDGGVTWSNIYAGRDFINIAAKGPNACFVNLTDTMYYTTNTGASVQKRKYNAPPALGPYSFGDVLYTNAGTCFASSGRYFFKSTNGGVLFDTLFRFGANSQSLNFLSFLDETEGWIVRSDGIYRTINGGSFWEIYNRPTPSGALLITYSSLPFGYITAPNTVYRTADNGNSWQTVFTGNPQAGYYIDVAWLDDQVAYMSYGNRIYKTVNGGGQWTVVAALGQGVFIEVHFTDANHGWACGSDGIILRFKI